MDRGFYFEETEGLFRKMACKGVTWNLDRRINFGQLLIKARERENARWPEREDDGGGGHCRR